MAADDGEDRKSIRRQASLQFRRMDSDDSGALNQEELEHALAERRLPCSPAALNEFFSRADANGDGLISKEEFTAFAEAQARAARAVYDEVDEDHDGRLSSDELRASAEKLGYNISSDQLRAIMQSADSDHDGVISFDEWCSFLLLLPAINPQAVFEAFGARHVIDHATSEGTPPIEVS